MQQAAEIIVAMAGGVCLYRSICRFVLVPLEAYETSADARRAAELASRR